MGPLSGFTIIEMKGLGPGPYAGMLLADLGAEVIVVERSSSPTSIAPPAAIDICSRGKKSISLNLKSAEGLTILLRLVAAADGIFEGFRPGVAEKLGFGPDACLACNPAIVYGRITGWGQTGPLSQAAGHDINYIALTGALAAIGTAEAPVPPLNVIGDYAGGSMFLVMGMLAALLEAGRSGRGQVVDAAITDGSASLMTMFYTLSQLQMWTPQRQGNLLDGGTPYYGVYKTRDGKFVALGPIEPSFFRQLIEKAELPGELINAQHNPAQWPDLRRALTARFAEKTREEWAAVFEGSDACVAPVLDYCEAPEHPHNLARNTYVELDGVMQPAVAPRFSRTSPALPACRQAEGANNIEVLTRLGYSETDICEYLARGVLT